MRRIAQHTLIGAIACAIAIPSLLTAQGGAKQVIVPPGASASTTLSPGIRVGDILYLSGQLGTKPGSPLDSTIQGQTSQALENLKGVVEAAGTTMSNVVKCTVFLADLKDFGGMNQAYTQFFPKEPPARSTVVVAALVRTGAKVEIECIAAIPR
jgi:2-iminobutanoate/2-iminopropanoate deaminase